MPHSPVSPLSLLFGFVLIGLVIGLMARIRLWQRGRGACAQVSPLLLLRIPKRYFIDLHHVVMRDAPMARIHVLVAGGTLALGVAGCIVLLSGYHRLLGWLGATLALLVALGVLGLMVRRAAKPAKLSYAKFSTMPYSLLLFALACAWLLSFGSNQDAASWVALAAGLLGALDIFWAGALERPFKHLLAGSAHLAFHPRQDRFSGKLSTDLRPLTGDGQHHNAPGQQPNKPGHSSHGVAKANDFSWRQLLGFDACIQCGRCQDACPAFAAGQPLNPKKLIQDMLLATSGGSDANYAGSNHPGHTQPRSTVGATAPLSPDFIATETIYACTTCRACVQACPMLIEHVDAIVDMRRHLALDVGDLPNKGQEVLANLRYSDNAAGYSCATRGDWAVDLELPFARPGEQVDVLLLSGEGGFDLRHQQTLRQLAKLLRRSGLSLALLSNEPDGGDLARRLGDEIGFLRLADKLGGRLGQLTFNRLVTCDPHLYNLLTNEYPPLGYHFRVQHHTQILLELIDAGQLEIAALNQRLTYHDPCYLARYNGETIAPRALLARLGVELIEMQRSAMQARCCGWGGGAAFTDIPGERRISDMRMDDVRETGAEQVAVACPNCMTMLEGVVAPHAGVIDLVELVAQAAELHAIRQAPQVPQALQPAVASVGI